MVLLDKDPRKMYQKRVRSLVNKSKTLFSTAEIKCSKVINHFAPNVKGLPKVHKDGVPIRPLVNYTSAPTYKLAKKLVKLLKQPLAFDINYSIKNFYDFI